EARAEERDHHGQQRLRGEEADEHPDGQQPAHHRVEADVGERPQRRAPNHAERGEAHRLARGDERLADREIEVAVDADLLDDAGEDVEAVVDPEATPTVTSGSVLMFTPMPK